MKKNINKTKILIIVLIAIISLTVNINAGVGFKKVIPVALGQTVNEFIRLQNLGVGESELQFEGTITEGSEIVSFTQKNKYNVANGEIIDVPISINLPNTAVIGDTYTIKMIFKETSSTDKGGDGESIQFTKSTGISFDILVVEESQESVTPQTPGKSGNNSLLWALAILIAVIIITIIIKRKR